MLRTSGPRQSATDDNLVVTRRCNIDAERLTTPSGRRIEVPSNFFLYFGSVAKQDSMAGMDMEQH
jgi:hypothetical protein